MSNWSGLPLEILNILFIHLKSSDETTISSKDLAQCALTCRQWRDPAQRVFFSEITVKKTRDIDRLSLTALENDRLGKWIKILRFAHRADFCCWSSILRMALLYPNLEEAAFRCDDFSYGVFYKMLTEHGKFGNLRVIPNAENKQQSELYLKCLDYLKDSITSIELIDGLGFDEHRYNRLQNKLHNYPKLNNVRIASPTLDFGKMTKYLKYVLDSDVIAFQNLSIIKANNDSVTFNFETQESTRLPSTAATLKEVYMTISNAIGYTHTENFMQLIMNRLPCMSGFYCVRQNEQYADSTFIVPSESLALTLFQFFKFLSKMDTYSFAPIPLPATKAIQLIEDFYNDIDEEEEFIALLPKRLLRVFFQFRRGNLCGSAVGIGCHTPSGYQVIDLVCFSKFREDFAENDTKQLEIIKKVGRFFDFIRLLVNFKENIFDTLSYLGAYCTRLIHLHINGSRWPKPPLEANKIALEECELVNFCKVETLTLINHIFSESELVNVLTRFPILKSLRLENCFMHSDEVPSQNLFSISLPDLSLDSLIIDVNLDFSDSTDEKSYCFKLTTDEDEISSYSCCILTSKYNDNKEIIGYN